ncbi:FMN adenylyltransferase [Achromatium sp. WMS2]|nr:FMN adenylyltransferase [Achromatium sp. WMS2]
MQIIRNIHNLHPAENCVATIGNFDGVHLGHQAVLRNLITRSKVLGLPSTVVTFEPQPQEYFFKHKAPPRLTRLREKLTAMQKLGIDRVLLLPFTDKLVAMAAETFIEQILVQKLAVKFLFVGDDFQFGRWRHGDFKLLQDKGSIYGFQVENHQTMRFEGERISSTRIREALRCGNLTMANSLLGRSYHLCGRVGHGAKRGRKLGYPTANIDLHRYVSPVRGVFGVKAFLDENVSWLGVANIGQRPTITGDNRILLEVFLFDFEGDLYHKHLTVELLCKLRDEQKFHSLDELSYQIGKDTTKARAMLATIGNN